MLTLAYLGYFLLPGSRRSDAFQLGRQITTAYLLLSSLLIAILVVGHTGYPGATVHQLVRHIEYRGVAVTVPSISGNTSNVRITGDVVDADSTIKRAFRWFALPTGAWIDLRPDGADGKNILSYRAEAHSSNQIVRLNRICVNDVIGGWISTGKSAEFNVTTPYKVQRRKSRHTSNEVQFKLSCDRNEIKLTSSLDGIAVRSLTLQDHISLRDLLRGPGSAKLREALSPLDNGIGASVLDSVQIARRLKGDGNSSIGIIYRVLQKAPKITNPDDDSYDQLARIRGLADQPDTHGPIEAVNGKFRLEVFGNESRNALILPSQEIATLGGHAQLQLLFDPPRAYPLPPASLLKQHGYTVQLATTDMGQDGSGYLFETGNLNEGFLSTAMLAVDGTRMSIAGNSTDAVPPLKVNENQVLGGGAVAPIFALADPLEGAGMPWLFPMVGLCSGLLICLVSFARIPIGKTRGRRQIPVNVAPVHTSFVLWVVTAAILAVRVVLAFRVSILPPFNMDTVSAASFRGAWTKAWIPALAFPPIIGFLTVAVVRAKQPAARQAWTEQIGEGLAASLRKVSARPWFFLSRAAYAVAAALGVLMLLLKKIHVPFPDIVLIGVLIVVLGLVFEGVGDAKDDDLEASSQEENTAQSKLSKWANGFSWAQRVMARRKLWQRNPLLWSAIAILFYLDPGTFLFFLPLVLALCVGGMIAAFGHNPATSEPAIRTRSKQSKFALGLALCLALLGVFASAQIGDLLLTNSVAGKILGSSSFAYRLAATNPTSAEHLLVDPRTASSSFVPHKMQETLHQRWEMLAYQYSNGAGYFAAPLSNVGMTYPTTLSDAAFSVYLVGEHGKLAGAMVVGLIILAALAIFRTAWTSACSRNQKANARGLYAIGGVFGCTAVYMALANLWVIPFTGQNVPLLSLNSVKDLLLNGTLLVAAILLIAYPGSWSTQVDPMAKRDAKAHAAWWWAFPGLIVIGWFVLCFDLATSHGDPALAFNLNRSTMATLKQTVDEARAQVRERQLPIEQTPAIAGAAPFIRAMVASFDSGEVTKTPIVEGRGASSNLQIDRKFFMLKSPFEHEGGVPWHGSVTASGRIKRHQLIVGGSRIPIVLESKAKPGELILGQPIKNIVAQTIDLKQVFEDKGRKRVVDYGGLKLDGDRVLLRWKNFGKPGAVLVNGQRPDLKFNELEIQESDIVSLEYTGPDGVPMKLSIHYLGSTENKLASVVWRNGRYVRTYPHGADFPLAYTIGEIGDDIARATKKSPSDLQISIDMQLQRDLQAELRRWAVERGRLINRGATMPDGLPFTALSILDSTSGQIRALASLPQCDPREDFSQIEDRFTTESDAQIAARSSWTLVNRTIGSTIKPLGFAALNSQLDSKSFNLTQLHVNEAAAIESYINKDGDSRRAYRILGDIHLKQGKGLGSKENPRSDVDMYAYLRDSRTWPAIVTSTLGLVADKKHPATLQEELSRILQPLASGAASIGSKRMAFTPGKALSRLFSNRTTLSSVELADTAFFKGIEDCYAPNVVPFNTNESNRWDDGLEKNFLAPLDLGVTNGQSLKNLGLPEVHWADTTNLTDLDGQLIRYMIGGGECRWNAVTMATNFARIMTGKKVQPTLSAQTASESSDMPSPIKGLPWRKAHLINPLLEITTIPAEVVAVIRSTVSKGGYRIAMKTGTIDDGMGSEAMESEMLMFTVGQFSDASGFVPGRSISGFFSIRSAKRAEGDVMVKGDLIKRVMPILVSYLKRLESQASRKPVTRK